jgi:hypothetical protein
MRGINLLFRFMVEAPSLSMLRTGDERDIVGDRTASLPDHYSRRLRGPQRGNAIIAARSHTMSIANPS